MAYQQNNNFNNRSYSSNYKSSNNSYQESTVDKIFNSYVTLTENNYVEFAEKSINALKEHTDRKVLTTSKIRNILALNAEIYNDVVNEPEELLSAEVVGRINYLKVRIIYECGREDSVKIFVNEAFLLKVIDEIKGSKKQYLLFSRYLEALVAYRKFICGRDED